MLLRLISIVVFSAASLSAAPSSHPTLAWSKESVVQVRAELGKHPAFDAAHRELKERADRALSSPIDVPQPKDAAGYTHGRHKQNYEEMYAAGLLYQLSGDVRYASFVRDMLFRYADLYPTLGNHPAGTSAYPGRLFHQTLNETVWLVHVAQAYDFIFDTLNPAERARIESGVLRPMATFFSVDRLHSFDRIHNHGTWASTAVGMLGYVLGDQNLVDQALYGSKKDGSAGYLRQMDELFSPDGLYCEGPYYGRYSMMPFFLFARCVEQNQPELGVFTRREKLLRSVLYTALQQTNSNGAFLPFNDSLKEKSLKSPEVVGVLAEVYMRFGEDPALLSIARRQGTVAFSPAGLKLAMALEKTPSPQPFPFASVEYRDGPQGTSGGLALLRAGQPEISLLCMKYGVHGMEHGHYDKLSFQFYEQDSEIVRDYGAARFLNIEQKSGGRYLPENKTWAMQTIAHNTVVVDGRSQFNGEYKLSDASHSERHFFDVSNPACQVVSARENKAYPGVTMLRTMALISDPRLARPFIVDLYRLGSATEHTYDYPLYYSGQFLSTNVPLTMCTSERRPLGQGHGYQHLWLVGEGETNEALRFTWMTGNRFYTMTSITAPTRLMLTQIGANDPKINLRSESGLILRRKGSDALFAAVIEPHGDWNSIIEYSRGSSPRIQSIEVRASTAEATVLLIKAEGGLQWTLMLNAGESSATAEHAVTVGSETYRWVGNVGFRSE